MSIDFLATPVAFVLKAIHSGLSEFLIPGSGPAWGLSIVLLTVCVRLALFPLFVKQIKSQRRMQQIAPLVKELQKKHKGDRETLNVEMMKLYKEHNANPISGCLPILVQLPIFFALFSVINEFGPGAKPKFGLTVEDLTEGGKAQILGAPISANFRTSAERVAELGAELTTVRIVAIVMIVLMGASTFWTQRQMMARAGAVTDPQQQMVQKVLLYVLPLSFAVSGVIFPIGVLLYWLTTNLWSMGQQHWVIKRMPPLAAGGSAGGAAGGKAGPTTGPKTGPSKGGPSKGGTEGKGKPAKGEATPSGTGDGTGDEAPEVLAAGRTVATATRATAQPNLTGQPSARRAAGSKKNKRNARKGGRR
jgi:YidC/Oxa1 family membrane protein insertase